MQEWIVGALVAAAAFSVAKRYLPKAARRALRTMFARMTAAVGLAALAQRPAAEPVAAAPSCADGCSSCGGCDLSARAKPKSGPSTVPLKSIK